MPGKTSAAELLLITQMPNTQEHKGRMTEWHELLRPISCALSNGKGGAEEQRAGGETALGRAHMDVSPGNWRQGNSAA